MTGNIVYSAVFSDPSAKGAYGRSMILGHILVNKQLHTHTVCILTAYQYESAHDKKYNVFKSF